MVRREEEKKRRREDEKKTRRREEETERRGEAQVAWRADALGVVAQLQAHGLGDGRKTDEQTEKQRSREEK